MLVVAYFCVSWFADCCLLACLVSFGAFVCMRFFVVCVCDVCCVFDCVVFVNCCLLVWLLSFLAFACMRVLLLFVCVRACCCVCVCVVFVKC